ncbi:MAG: sigma-54-dependent Fis family transcriptional regulator [Verrucomicrobia bacterium]|nr:sigma-54-dependent Fis family transcriptional regulator [Verrucomicrobiota bacterium]
MGRQNKVLLIEDDRSTTDLLRRALQEDGYDVVVLSRGDEGLERATKDSFSLVITDLELPGLNGLDVVRRIHAVKPHLPIILITACGTAETTIEAIRHGAYDYLVKPFEMPEFLDLVDKATSIGRLMSEPVVLGANSLTGEAMIGNSRAMQNIYKEIGRVADKSITVLIRGETGTGKELAARAIYQHSSRFGKPFIAMNCAAIPETLLESELFGHERGAFTGADTRRIGRFEQADHGTILLDEIGDMSLNTQAKLLRVLQEKCLQRLGGRETIPIDVRVIAATHRDLGQAIRNKLFRDDLYYRLSVVVITLPPLRNRVEDIPQLAAYFIRRYCAELEMEVPSLSAECLELLQQQAWPGNIRELENALRNVLLLSRGFAITEDDLRKVLKPSSAANNLSGNSLATFATNALEAAQRGETEGARAALLEEVERELFAQAICMANGNQAKAARWLGVSRVTMREKLTHFGCHPAQTDDRQDGSPPG